ncbi:hypothetical protein [Ruminococcus albus]|nr:hypothetical protein [Ruminococcus albus]MCC3349374.1 hypothetical protein [Ruminococcus albus 8]
MEKRMDEKKARKLTAVLVLTGIMLPIIAMFIMLSTELIWVSALLGSAEVILGALISAKFYNCADFTEDNDGESYL